MNTSNSFGSDGELVGRGGSGGDVLGDLLAVPVDAEYPHLDAGGAGIGHGESSGGRIVPRHPVIPPNGEEVRDRPQNCGGADSVKLPRPKDLQWFTIPSASRPDRVDAPDPVREVGDAVGRVGPGAMPPEGQDLLGFQPLPRGRTGDVAQALVDPPYQKGG